MATKERAGGRLLRFPRRDTVNLSRRAFMGMAEAGVGFLLAANRRNIVVILKISL